MSFLLPGSGTTQGLRNGVIPKHKWEEVKAEVTRLYMDERMTLKQVMALMKRGGFTATRKQYKTQFDHWSLRKNRRSNRLQPSRGRISDRDDAASSAASDIDSSTPEPQEPMPAGPIYHPRGASESNRSPQLVYQQQPLIYTSWQPPSGSLLHNTQVDATSSMMQPPRSGGHPYINPLPQNTTTTIRGLLRHCDIGLTHAILLPEDIDEIERVADLLTLVCSQQDAFKVAHTLLFHIAAIPPYPGRFSSHVARTAVTVIRNARVLHNCKQIVTLLSVAIYSGANLRSRDDKHWPLLLSFFGPVLQESAGASSQQSLRLCHTAAQNFGRMSPSEIFDWRYLVLITNIKQVCTVSDMQYDVNAAWSAYYIPRRLSTAIRNIDGYLERLIMWCTAALDDANSWGAFNAFSADLWISTLEPADVSELECKTLFCYFYSCLQSNSHVATHSECHVLLQEALAGLQQHLNITTWESLSTISRILMLSNAQPYSGDNRSNLVHRALCRMQEVRQLRPPLGILTASGWASSSLSATFLETLAQHYCHPYRFSSLRYKRRVDDQVRDFLEHHLILRFSMNAFMQNPFAQMSPMGIAEGSTTASLVDLIMYEKSLD